MHEKTLTSLLANVKLGVIITSSEQDNKSSEIM